MRKSEMTEKQLQERRKFIDILVVAGWEETIKNKLFERGLWLNEEASMEYHSQDMSLAVGYSGNKDVIYLSIENALGIGVSLTIYFEDKLTQLLDAIISFQDKITSANYKMCIRKILQICPLTYADLDEEGVMLLLVDNGGDFNQFDEESKGSGE